jgi:hypothetical protein
MPKYFTVSLSKTQIAPTKKDDFEQAEQGHCCDPTECDCLRFRNRLKIRIRKDKRGNILLQVTTPRKPA